MEAVSKVDTPSPLLSRLAQYIFEASSKLFTTFVSNRGITSFICVILGFGDFISFLNHLVYESKTLCFVSLEKRVPVHPTLDFLNRLTCVL